ncbi:MAG: ATP-binding protein [Kofleriaceae bacterium]
MIERAASDRGSAADRVDILIVDDRPQDVLAATAVLNDPRYRITTAASGAEALHALLRHDFAVIVLDVRLPDMDGFEVAGLVRSRERSMHTPIVFVTGEASDVEAIYRGYAAGAIDYLLKPVSADILRAKVRIFVELFDKDRRIQQQTQALLVAERERRELELTQIQLDNARHYRNLADAIPHLVWTTDATGATMYLNKRWSETAKIAFQPGVSWLDAIVGEHERELCRNGIASSNPFELECGVRYPDGQVRWHLCRAVPECDPRGKVVGWIGTLTDIGDLRRAMAAAEAAQRRSDFLSAASAALSAAGAWSAGVQELLNAARESVADACVVDLTIDGHGRDVLVGGDSSGLAERWRDEIRAPVDRPELISDLARSRLSRVVEGTPLESAVISQIVSGARVRGTVCLFSRLPSDFEDLSMVIDLAGRIGGTIERALLYEQANEAIQARDDFLSVASHELRTPLSALLVQLGSAERSFVARDERSEKIRGKISAALRHTSRLTGLVDSLLDVSRLAAHRLTLQPEACDLGDIAGEVVERFGDEARRAGCEVKLEVVSTPGRWDRVRIEQVITNLVSNAIKYGAHRPIDITVQKSAVAQLIVRDRGIGIAEQDRARIFDRFERVVAPQHYGGLGLGLYITREIVEAHGGEIAVDGKPGEGTTFTVSLPLTGRRIEKELA